MTAEQTLRRFDEKQLDAVFAELDSCHEPGGAVAIAIGGIPVYRKGFGLANIELPVLLSSTIRMRIGSTTKHFICLAYMLLCEDGKANIDDPVEKYIPEIHPVAHGITIRQLMGHTSGLRDSLAVSMFTNGTGAPVTRSEMTAYYQTIGDLDFAPGTAWSYNNGAYTLLSTVIERLTADPLDDILRKRIFQPLGMHYTMLRRWDSGFVPNSATLHMASPQGGFTRDVMGPEYDGAGGLVATMDDMLIWLKHMDAPTIGSVATWDLMRTPFRLPNGISTGYGLGLVIDTYRGVDTISHSGGVMSGNSQMIKVPAAGLDISIAINRSDVGASSLANKVIDLLVEGLTPQPPKKTAEPISGLYVSPSSGRVVELSAANGGQMASFDGFPMLPMDIDEGGMLQLPETLRNLQISFLPHDNEGSLFEFDIQDRMDKIEPNTEAKLSDMCGEYHAASIGAFAMVQQTADGPRLTFDGAHGRAAYTLEPLTVHHWRAASLGISAIQSGIITFADDGQSFDLTSTRLRHVRFIRRCPERSSASPSGQLA